MQEILILHTLSMENSILKHQHGVKFTLEISFTLNERGTETLSRAALHRFMHGDAPPSATPSVIGYHCVLTCSSYVAAYRW